jgi:uncharacterized protein (TIGR02391 family)
MNAISQFIEINRLLRSIAVKSRDAIDKIYQDGDGSAGYIISYIKRDYRSLSRVWPDPESYQLTKLDEYVDQGNTKAFVQVTEEVLPVLEDELDGYFASLTSGMEVRGIEGLLHPVVIRSSYHQFRNGQYRDAVLNAIVAVFDLIRERTGLDIDGSRLVQKGFSLDDPILVLSTIESESGKNEQKGFIQILQGAFLGIRNPKAHSLSTDLNQEEAAQYLVFASLLARRIDEARQMKR